MRPHLTDRYLLSQGLSKTIVERFFQKIIKTETCWFWIGTISREGYGSIGAACIGRRMKMVLAHRVSWLIHFGPIPEACDVLHNCPGRDNPTCVNPFHLWTGSHWENMQDKIRKGMQTAQCGPKNGCAKLSWEDVKEIRSIHENGVFRQKDIAARFHVSQRTICKIVNGISYVT